MTLRRKRFCRCRNGVSMGMPQAIQRVASAPVSAWQCGQWLDSGAGGTGFLLIQHDDLFKIVAACPWADAGQPGLICGCAIKRPDSFRRINELCWQLALVTFEPRHFAAGSAQFQRLENQCLGGFETASQHKCTAPGLRAIRTDFLIAAVEQDRVGSIRLLQHNQPELARRIPPLHVVRMRHEAACKDKQKRDGRKQFHTDRNR